MKRKVGSGWSVVGLEKAPIKSYQDLKVWNAAMDLAHETYKVTAAFPKEEVYGLTAQLRRAAASIRSNIAEGFGRENRGSFAQYLLIAQGSLKELATQILLAARIKYLGESDLKPILDRADEVGKMIRGLVNSIRRGGSKK